MNKVLVDSGCDVKDIIYVEVYGIGIVVGDLLEIKVIVSVYGSNGSCYVGLVKVSIGYLEVVVGIVSVIKFVMMFQYNFIFLVVGLEEVNLVIFELILLLRILVFF